MDRFGSAREFLDGCAWAAGFDRLALPWFLAPPPASWAKPAPARDGESEAGAGEKAASPAKAAHYAR